MSYIHVLLVTLFLFTTSIHCFLPNFNLPNLTGKDVPQSDISGRYI